MPAGRIVQSALQKKQDFVGFCLVARTEAGLFSVSFQVKSDANIYKLTLYVDMLALNIRGRAKQAITAKHKTMTNRSPTLVLELSGKAMLGEPLSTRKRKRNGSSDGEGGDEEEDAGEIRKLVVKRGTEAEDGEEMAEKPDEEMEEEEEEEE